MKRALLSLCFLNLFFIGLLIGVVFVKQNAVHSVLSANPMVNYQELSTPERIKFFSKELGMAFRITTHRLLNRWGNLYGRLKTGTFFSGGNIPENRIIHGAVVGEKMPLATKIPNKEIARNTAIHESPKENVSSAKYQPVNLAVATPTPKSAGGRSDPFVDLPVKIQAKEKPKIKEMGKNLKTTAALEKFKTKDTGKMQTAQEPKPEEKSQTGPENEKVGSEILKKYHLRGIVIGASSAAYFEDQNGFQKVTTGDSFAGGKIIKITVTNVTIQFGEKKVDISLEGQK